MFDPVGTLKIVNDQFHIVVPAEVASIQHHLENIYEVFGTVRFQCRENEEIDIHQCHNMLQPLEALYNDIQRDFKSISHIISNSVAKRSAWFAGVGTVFKHIFGTMDEDDAENYKNAMLALYNNDKKLANSITKTIMVSQSAISNMNNSLHEINMNQAKLSDVIDQLTLSFRNVTKIINVMSFKAKLSSVFNILQSNLLTLSFKVEDLLNSILFVKSNTLHPSMLTPNQMYNDIVNNLKIIPKHRDFPVSLDINSIHTLINVAELVCYYLDNKLMFIIKLPLVSLLEYNVYRNIPLPTPHSTSISNMTNSFALILPSDNFLALSKDKSTYTYLKDLSNCKNIFLTTYLCEINDIHTVLDNPSCEIEIITKALSSIPKNCPYRFISGHVHIWHKLNNNKWIFVLSKPAKLSLECNSVVTDTIIVGTGVLTIPPECIAFSGNVKLVSKFYPKIKIPYISSDFNIIGDNCCTLSIFNKIKLNIPVSKIENVNLDNLKQFKSVTDEVVQDLKTLESPNNFINNVSFPIISILSALLCLILIIITFCKKGKFSQKLKLNKNNITNHSDIPDDTPNLEQVNSPRLRIE